MNKNIFIQKLHEIGAIQFGNFTLKNGEISSVYIDLRKLISYPTLLLQASKLMWNIIQPKKNSIHYLCGVPYTALPIATCLSVYYDFPMVIRRKEKKLYGTKKLIEGVFKYGEKCCIIEDVMTTGSSILETAKDLTTVGMDVTDAIVLIDREQGADETIKKNNIQVQSVFKLTDILN